MELCDSFYSELQAFVKVIWQTHARLSTSSQNLSVLSDILQGKKPTDINWIKIESHNIKFTISLSDPLLLLTDQIGHPTETIQSVISSLEENICKKKSAILLHGIITLRQVLTNYNCSQL